MLHLVTLALWGIGLIGLLLLIAATIHDLFRNP